MNDKVKEHLGKRKFYVFAIFDTTFGDMDQDVKSELARNDGFFAQREFELLVIPNLGLRLLFDACKMVNRPSHPIKLVESVEAALKYLEDRGKNTEKIRLRIPELVLN